MAFQRVLHRLSIAASCACIAALAALSLAPSTLRPHTSYGGHAEHFIAYFFTAFPVGVACLSMRARVRATLGLVACAGAFEILQIWAPGRSPAVSDWTFSSSGAMCGMLAVSLLLALLVRRDILKGA